MTTPRQTQTADATTLDSTFDITATCDAIKILRDTQRWLDVCSVGKSLLCRTWMRLEDEAKGYLAGR